MIGPVISKDDLPNSIYYQDMVDCLNTIYRKSSSVDATLNRVAFKTLQAFKTLHRKLGQHSGTVYMVTNGFEGTSRLYPLTGTNKSHLFVPIAPNGPPNPIKCGEKRILAVANKRFHLKAANAAHADNSPLLKQFKVKQTTAPAKYVLMMVSKKKKYHAIGLSPRDLEAFVGMKEYCFSQERKINDRGW